MEISLIRDAPIQVEDSQIAAPVYNLGSILLARQGGGALFVPIRAMQYLAILDREEFVFVDSQYRDRVEIAWREFRPQARTGLDDPVPCLIEIYHPDGHANLARLRVEFPLALQALATKAKPKGEAVILRFIRPQPTSS